MEEKRKKEGKIRSRGIITEVTFVTGRGNREFKV